MPDQTMRPLNDNEAVKLLKQSPLYREDTEMICPVCHNKVTMTMREMERVFLPHKHSDLVLYCPASGRTAKEAFEIAKAEDK